MSGFPRDETPSRAGLNAESLVFSRRQQLRNPSPPCCVPPVQHFTQDYANVPASSTIERLAKKMSRQTIGCHPRPCTANPNPSGIAGPKLGVNPMVDSGKTLSDRDLMPRGNSPSLDLEISPDFDSRDGCEDQTLVNSLVMPTLYLSTQCRAPNTAEAHRSFNTAPTSTSTAAAVQPSCLGQRNFLMGKDADRDAAEALSNTITNKTQYQVHQVSDPMPASTSSLQVRSPRSTKLTDAPFEPGPPLFEIPDMELEIDENPEEYDMSSVDRIVTMRKAASPAGLRRHGLRYRASRDAAQRCTTLVRHVPQVRLRNRHKSSRHPDKSALSVASGMLVHM